MNISATITKRIDYFEPGVIFSYRDIQAPSAKIEAVAAALSRLVSKGIIKRYEKGKFFKPQQGAFGEMPVKENQILESVLKQNGHLTGYLTGTAAYNQIGLTTQIANEYIIATNEVRKPIKNGRFNARFVKAYSEITENNIPLLQLLDAVKDINSISGTDPNTAIKLIIVKLKELSLSEQKKIAQLALNYPPSTRALIGAIFELSGNNVATGKLFESLNQLSKYKLGIKESILPNKNKWKIE